MLPAELNDKLLSILKARHEQPVSIINTNSLGGGCINNAVKVETNIGDLFIKWNQAKKYPGMFESEAQGLQLLISAGEIHIPEVVAHDEIHDTAFLILEFVEPERTAADFWEDFGCSLAKLHKHTNELFGLDHDNYIGSLPQSNKQHDNWIDFFIQERLEPQIRKAGISGHLSKKFNGLFNVLDEIFPHEPPALLHGDLWSGNYMTAPNGKACVFDPAVYYGHREMDIAMTRLFGGFSKHFYDAYNAEHPLESGWENRLDICNIYPLMVHVNLFGGGYLGQVQGILRKF